MDKYIQPTTSTQKQSLHLVLQTFTHLVSNTNLGAFLIFGILLLASDSITFNRHQTKKNSERATVSNIYRG